jgi:RNA polymerase sigma-70 factor (ECF subfamily)
MNRTDMENEVFKEEELVQRLGKSDSYAYRLLYEKYGPQLHALCFRFRFSKEEAEEIVQETFIRIWQNRQAIDPARPFGRFLITIAKHLIYNQIRHNKYRSDYLNHIKSELKVFPPDQPKERELQQLVDKAVRELPDKCSQVFRKSRFEGYSNQQIAEELHISKSTVENQLNKALKKIRNYIERHGYSTLHALVICGGIQAACSVF